jgi:hypothetical protein
MADLFFAVLWAVWPVKLFFSRVFPQFAECLLVGCALVMLGLRKRGVNAAFFFARKKPAPSIE